MVCAVCNSVLLRHGKEPRPGIYDEIPLGHHDPPKGQYCWMFEHHPHGNSLRRSAEEVKCTFCLKLWRQVTSEHKDLVTSDATAVSWPNVESFATIESNSKPQSYSAVGGKRCWLYTLFLNFLDKDGLSINAKRPESNSGFSRFTYQTSFTMQEPQPEGLPHLDNASAPHLTLPLETFSERMSLAARWLRYCDSTHDRCLEGPLRRGWNPTRLIDVLALGPDMVNIVEGACLQESTPYMTLSHCWGKARFLTLTMESKSAFEKGVKVTALSKTFQDAIRVCRAVGQRYLWIDSLCIIQEGDQLADWRHEATLMSEVYTHSYCNISATGAVDSTGGLFLEPCDERGAVTEVELVDDVALAATSHAPCEDPPKPGRFRKIVRSIRKQEVPNKTTPPNAHVVHCIAYSQYFSEEVHDAHINHRAWVLQERILAKRIIHFNQKQLFWECSELEGHEIAPLGHPRSTNAGTRGTVQPFRTAINGGHQLSTTHLEQHWTAMVDAYCKCRLTNPSDKLIALAGIAKRFSHLTDGRYLAGMWSQFLTRQIFWIYREMHQPRERREDGTIKTRQPSRTKQYIAPSWSWASVDGVCSFPPSVKNQQFEILDVKMKFATPDEYAFVESAQLILRGKLRRVGLHRKPVNEVMAYDWVPKPPYDIVVDSWNCMITRKRGHGFHDRIEHRERYKYHDKNPDWDHQRRWIAFCGLDKQDDFPICREVFLTRISRGRMNSACCTRSKAVDSSNSLVWIRIGIGIRSCGCCCYGARTLGLGFFPAWESLSVIMICIMNRCWRRNRMRRSCLAWRGMRRGGDILCVFSERVRSSWQVEYASYDDRHRIDGDVGSQQAANDTSSLKTDRSFDR